ncbi:MAG: PEGA domain-containing protein [Candidatus Latescibacteria bacterium]|nr:PEGA domain-containing protein [Candidatus Latescibacterota bacterium]
MRLKRGVVLLFVGERRSGKTSVLFQIQEGKLGQEFLPIFIDMQAIGSVTSDTEFFRYMADRTCEAAHDERIVADYYNFVPGTNPIITFDSLLDDLRKIYSAADKHLIFLFDEAEGLRNKVASGELTGNIFTYMARILESRRISFCFTGSSGLPESQSEQWRRLIAKAVYKKISFLSKTDTRRLVTEPGAGEVTYAEGVVEAIYDLTYGHPYYTQVICMEIVNYLNGTQKHHLTREELDGIVETILDNPPQNMIYSWDELSRPEQITLSLLSEQSGDERSYVGAETLAGTIQENGYPLEMEADTLHIHLESLYGREVLAKNEEGAYRFNLDLYRQWVRRSRSIWRLLEEQRPKKSKRWIWAAGIGAAVLAAGIVGFFLLRGPPEEGRQVSPAEVRGGFQPTTGYLHITSDPIDAEVWIDGQRVGRTPTTKPEMAPGRHIVTVRLDGYRPLADTVEVVTGKRDTIDVSLKRLMGRLSVQSTPPGSQVSSVVRSTQAKKHRLLI